MKVSGNFSIGFQCLLNYTKFIMMTFAVSLDATALCGLGLRSHVILPMENPVAAPGGVGGQIPPPQNYFLPPILPPQFLIISVETISR